MFDISIGDRKLVTNYKFECYSNYHFNVPDWVPGIGGMPFLKRKTPKLKWSDSYKNLVVTTGLNQVLDSTFKTGTRVPAPTTTPTINVTGGGSSGGSLQAGSYYLKYTFFNAQGETTVSTESSQFTVSAGNIPRVTVQALPAGATGWRIYLTAAGGAQNSETKYNSDYTSTPIDLSAAQSSGAAMPSNNTAYYGPLWYVGLKNAGTVLAGDTMQSQTNWAEIVPYSNSTRPAFTPGTISSGSVDNSAAKAVFNINATATVVGAFMANDATKSGTFGILYGAGDFSSSRSVANGDTLNVTVTLTQS